VELETVRRVGKELLSKLPWQEVADSPTVRYYTDWSRFEGYVPVYNVEVERRAGLCEVVVAGGVDVGSCRGVEVREGGDVFKYLSISSRILALHASALSRAVYVRVVGALERPLVIRLLGYAPAGGHVASHVVLEVEREASGSVVVVAESGAGVMHTAVVEGVLRGGVEYVLVSKAAGPQYLHSSLEVYSEARARPLVTGGVMNTVREEYIIGERAAVEVVGLELGVGDSRIDHLVSVVNVGREGRGYAKLIGVARDKSFVTQRAVGKIAKTGVMSDNAVEGVIYIAGEGAVANTQPVILVETGEVAGARHSAADASLDEEKEFFLRARGVPKSEIPTLLITSLVDQYLSSLSDSAREVVSEIL